MRKVWLSKEDFELFHQDITPEDYEFFRTHIGTFKRMWQDQSPKFWSIFVSTFEYFVWNYGVMKDFPMTAGETHTHIDEIIRHIKEEFVDGKVSSAKALLMDCVIVTQNRNCIVLLDKSSYTQNPFYMKETREIFRKLFGAPDSRRTYLKLLCGLQVFIKFAGAVVVMLRRWLDSEEIPSDDERSKKEYFSKIHRRISEKPSSRDVRSLLFEEAELRKRVAALEPPRRDKAGRDDKLAAKQPGETNGEEVKKKKKKKKKVKADKLSEHDGERVLHPSSSDTPTGLSQNPPDDETRKKGKTLFVSSELLPNEKEEGLPPKLLSEEPVNNLLTSGELVRELLPDLPSMIPPMEAVREFLLDLPSGEPVEKLPSDEPVKELSPDLPSGEPVEKLPSDEPVKELSPGLPSGEPVEKLPSDEPVKELSPDLPSGEPVEKLSPNPEELSRGLSPELGEPSKGLSLELGEPTKGLSPELGEPTKGLSPELDETSKGLSPELTESTKGLSPELDETSKGFSPELTESTKGLSPELTESTKGLSPELDETSKGLSPELTESTKGLPLSSSPSQSTTMPETDQNAVLKEAMDNIFTYFNAGVAAKLSSAELEGGAPEMMNRVCQKVMEADGMTPEHLTSKIRNHPMFINATPRAKEVDKERTQKENKSVTKKPVEDDKHVSKEPTLINKSVAKDSATSHESVAKDSATSNEPVAKESATSHEPAVESETLDHVSKDLMHDNPVAKHPVETDELTARDENKCVSIDLTNRKEISENVHSMLECENKDIISKEDENDIDTKEEPDKDSASKKKLHICHFCGLEETVAKNFKRCQKCRGRPNPSYYCSRECQVKHWKTHKLEHKSEPTVTG